MKILWISPKLPFPLTSGDKIRQYNLIKLLSRRYSIFLVSFLEREGDRRYIPELERYCTVRGIPLPPRAPLGKRVCMAVSSVKPFVSRRYFSREMAGAITEILNGNGFDIVQIEHEYLSFYLDLMRETPVRKILTMHNIESLLYRRHFERDRNVLRRAYWFGEWLKLRSYEREVLGKFDRIVVMSEQDKRLIGGGLDNINISVVPNGVDVGSYPVVEEDSNSLNLVFTGSLGYFPNEDAVLFFSGRILPLIRKEFPRVKFYVVGRDPTPRLKKLEADPDIVVTGPVDDVRPHMGRATVFVVPLRVGGGTRLMILEAMAMARPVVSTTIGAEGLDVTHGENILMADGPEEFARAVIRLLRDGDLRREMGRAGRKLVEKEYDWEICAGLMERVYQETRG